MSNIAEHLVAEHRARAEVAAVMTEATMQVVHRQLYPTCESPFGHWETTPEAVADWKYEVANGDTLLGFHEWAATRDENESTQCRGPSGRRLPRRATSGPRPATDRSTWNTCPFCASAALLRLLRIPPVQASGRCAIMHAVHRRSA